MFVFNKKQRALSEIDKRRGLTATYTEKLPRDAPDLKEFLSDFYRNILFQRQAEMNQELLKYPNTVGKLYNELVLAPPTPAPNTKNDTDGGPPPRLAYEDFWQRYYYRTNSVDRVMAELEAADEEIRRVRTEAIKDTWSSVTNLVGGSTSKSQDNNDDEVGEASSASLGGTKVSNPLDLIPQRVISVPPPSSSSLSSSPLRSSTSSKSTSTATGKTATATTTRTVVTPPPPRPLEKKKPTPLEQLDQLEIKNAAPVLLDFPKINNDAVTIPVVVDHGNQSRSANDGDRGKQQQEPNAATSDSSHTVIVDWDTTPTAPAINPGTNKLDRLGVEPHQETTAATESPQLQILDLIPKHVVTLSPLSRQQPAVVSAPPTQLPSPPREEDAWQTFTSSSSAASWIPEAGPSLVAVPIQPANIGILTDSIIPPITNDCSSSSNNVSEKETKSGDATVKLDDVPVAVEDLLFSKDLFSLPSVHLVDNNEHPMLDSGQETTDAHPSSITTTITASGITESVTRTAKLEIWSGGPTTSQMESVSNAMPEIDETIVAANVKLDTTILLPNDTSSVPLVIQPKENRTHPQSPVVLQQQKTMPTVVVPISTSTLSNSVKSASMSFHRSIPISSSRQSDQELFLQVAAKNFVATSLNVTVNRHVVKTDVSKPTTALAETSQTRAERLRGDTSNSLPIAATSSMKPLEPTAVSAQDRAHTTSSFISQQDVEPTMDSSERSRTRKGFFGNVFGATNVDKKQSLDQKVNLVDESMLTGLKPDPGSGSLIVNESQENAGKSGVSLLKTTRLDTVTTGGGSSTTKLAADALPRQMVIQELIGASSIPVALTTKLDVPTPASTSGRFGSLFGSSKTDTVQDFQTPTAKTLPAPLGPVTPAKTASIERAKRSTFGAIFKSNNSEVNERLDKSVEVANRAALTIEPIATLQNKVPLSELELSRGKKIPEAVDAAAREGDSNSVGFLGNLFLSKPIGQPKNEVTPDATIISKRDEEKRQNVAVMQDKSGSAATVAVGIVAISDVDKRTGFGSAGFIKSTKSASTGGSIKFSKVESRKSTFTKPSSSKELDTKHASTFATAGQNDDSLPKLGLWQRARGRAREKPTNVTEPTSRSSTPITSNKVVKSDKIPGTENRSSYRNGACKAITLLIAILISAIALLVVRPSWWEDAGNGFCGPVMPGHKVVAEENSILTRFEAPWWVPFTTMKKSTFHLFCGLDRIRTVIELNEIKRGIHRLEILDADRQASVLASQKHTLKAEIFSKRIDIHTTNGKFATIVAPWTMRKLKS